MGNAKISVIIPVYNTAQYLPRCAESIRTQTYNNLEIIYVDDGSADGGARQIDDIAVGDSRVIAIHKRNGGQAEARNYGIQISSGDLIGFVDSDDFISDEMYSYLVKLLHDNSADFAECSMTRFTEIPDFRSDEKVTILEGKAIIEGVLGDKYFTSTVWNLIVKADIGKSVLFDVGKIHEDILWPYRVLAKCKRAVSSTKVLYAYYQREESTMNREYSPKRFDGLDALETRAREIRQIYPELYPRAERSYAGACMYQYQYLSRQKKCDKYSAYMEILHRRFCAADRKAFIPCTEFKYKVWYAMFAAMPRITCLIRNTLRIGL